MKKYIYIIMSVPYTENCGGIIVLHKLCDLLNEIGERAYMFPATKAFHGNNIVSTLIKRIVYLRLMRKEMQEYKINREWNAPLFPFLKALFSLFTNKYIVVYPEFFSNNPLQAKNIVRYLLHNPGNFSAGKYEYGENELYFRYSGSFAKDFVPKKGGKISSKLITVSSTPSCYNRIGVDDSKRSGVAYCIRKGAGKKLIHDRKNEILIDGKSHEEIAEIFKSVECFVSYDSVTAYTRFACLCGCRSYVVLGENEKPEDFRPLPEQRKYIRFDLNDMSVDVDEAYQFYERQRQEEIRRSIENVRLFVEECESFFGSK